MGEGYRVCYSFFRSQESLFTSHIQVEKNFFGLWYYKLTNNHDKENQLRVINLLNFSVNEFKEALPKSRFWRGQAETAPAWKARATGKRREEQERRLKNQKTKFPYFDSAQNQPQIHIIQLDKEHSEFESFKTHILDYLHAKSSPLIIFVEKYLNK